MCKGKNPSTFEPDLSEEGIPYLSMGYLRGQEAPKYAKAESTAVMAKEGDILLLWDGSNAGEFILAKSGLVSSTMARVMANRDCVHKYYFYSCKAFEPELKQHTVGMGIPHVNGEEVRTQSFPQPPKEEQELIANFLDHETAKIDTLIDKQQQLIKLLKEKRQAVISHAVTKGLNPDVPMKNSGVVWLGEVPEHWDRIPLKHLVSIPIIDGPHVSPEKRDDGVPFISAEAVGKGFIDFEKKWGYISQDDHALFSKRYSPEFDDILVIKLGATTGIAAIVETKEVFRVLPQNLWVDFRKWGPEQLPG
jgi:type I restriction enzyme S subunit